MALPSETVKEFVANSYQLISAANPTVPLQNDDLSQGIRTLNRLMRAYSGTGLMISVPKEIIFTLNNGVGFVTIGSPDYIPTPDITSEGRLANLQSAWIVLDNVTYPLIIESRNEFFYAYKFGPLAGLPRYIIVFPQTNLTTIQVYPKPSQTYELHIYGKFELPDFDANSTMENLPDYALLFYQFALAKQLAFMRGRASAWTELLEAQYVEFRKDIEATSTFNLDIQVDRDSKLNGKWRVEAGV